MNELTAEEKQIVINALLLAPIQGNKQQVEVVLEQIDNIIAKLSTETELHPNGDLEKVNYG